MGRGPWVCRSHETALLPLCRLDHTPDIARAALDSPSHPGGKGPLHTASPLPRLLQEGSPHVGTLKGTSPSPGAWPRHCLPRMHPWHYPHVGWVLTYPMGSRNRASTSVCPGHSTSHSWGSGLSESLATAGLFKATLRWHCPPAWSLGAHSPDASILCPLWPETAALTADPASAGGKCFGPHSRSCLCWRRVLRPHTTHAGCDRVAAEANWTTHLRVLYRYSLVRPTIGF